ncbi:hypothetical protein ACFPVX_00380 [Cohnella faecalis]|uniref:DUF2140 family protein n=1 Tax=Cohnella faecalis TaxID=2315694 RepID=A0A398CHI3_9BACL|nr:hypothetical protein [Cohnella faecalis]RIE02223.1 hypothetical protein D3H35_15925 [Cohnella faecalis]
MKKLILFLVALLLLAVLAGAGLILYIAPDKGLNLAYEQVPVKDRAIEMVKRMKLELVLSEEDVINLAKASVADNPQVKPDVRVTGADFDLQGELLIANLKVLWKERIPVGLQVTYRLSWQSPNLVATVVEAKAKKIKLPLTAFDDQIIPLGDELPKLIQIKGIAFENDEAKVSFKKPSLKDLRSLIE